MSIADTAGVADAWPSWEECRRGRTDRLGVGAFALVIDAKDDNALAFYEAHEVILLTGETTRLFLPIATALSALK